MATVPYPKTTTYLEAEEMKLGEMVLVHNRQFIVPLNQRPWTWKDARDVQSLLNDFERVLAAFFSPESSPKWKRRSAASGAPHFFGTFVLFKRSAAALEIFDGQQRLTAICMLCAVLREIAHNAGSIAGPHQVEASNLYGGFNEWLRITPSSNVPRVVPNSFFKDLFDALIFESVDSASRQSALDKLPQVVKTHEVSKKLIKSFDHIRDWVLSRTDALTPGDKTNFVKASYDTLRELFCCIETLIYQEQYAYEVFGCLNARGEKLSPADNIKNDLFTVSPKSAHRAISEYWNKIGENVPGQDIGEFLRRRHIALHGACKKNDTHFQIRQVEIEGHNAASVTNSWHDDSVTVRKIVQREAGFAKKETLDRLEIIFDVLKVSLAYIPLLIASKEFLPSRKNEFDRCVQLVEDFVFRSLTIEKTDTPELERKLGEAARTLQETGSIADFRSYLVDQSDDVRFEEAFAQHVERRVKVQYYILRELETRLLGGGKGVIPGDHHNAKNHIEHILPKRLSNAQHRKHEWSWARVNPDKHQSLTNRLGNLLILESDINKQVGNLEFKVKQKGRFKRKSGRIKQLKCYADSALMWPRRLAKVRWSDWTERRIVKRQQEMAADALMVWHL